MYRPWTPLLVVAALSTGCFGNNDPESEISGAVLGRITDNTGVGVSDAFVNLTLLSAPGFGPERVLATAQGNVDTDGKFNVAWRIFDEDPQDGRLSIQVTPPAASGLPGKDTTGIIVVLTSGYPPRDTTDVEIVVNANLPDPSRKR